MLPEVRTFIERADAHRRSLEGLIDAMPGDYWERRAEADMWTARNHLEHVATIEDLLAEDLERVIAGVGQMWVGGSPDAAVLERRRTAAMAAVAALTVKDLTECMSTARRHAGNRLALLTPQALEVRVMVPGVVDAWGQPLGLLLREYLAAWPTHDTEHEAAIRYAITRPPDMSAVALTRRRLQ